MKSTGVVRKVDSLGRIVIPKEIRKNLNIKDDDGIEIFIDEDMILLKKYSFLGKFTSITSSISEIFYNFSEKNMIITDLDYIISCDKKINHDYNNKKISSKYFDLINRREVFVSVELSNLNIIDNLDLKCYYMIAPIVVNGDLLGSICIFSTDNEINDKDKLLFNYILKFLIKNLED